MKFQAVYAINAPYVFYDNNTNVIGVNVDTANVLAEMLNFSIEYYKVHDDSFGTFHEENSNWNGVIGDLINGKANLSVSDLGKELECSHL